MKLYDSELMQKLKNMVKNERELLTEILRHLREVELRKLYIERGYSSMFAFCTEALGYSESEAHIRIQAMRLMTSVPMVEEKIESGELSLSVAAKVQSNFRKAKTPLEDKQEVIESVLGKSTREAERELAERFPEAPKPEVMRAMSGGRTQIAFLISDECHEKLDRLKQRMAHKNFDGQLGILFEELVDLGLKKYEKVPKKKAGPSHDAKRANVETPAAENPPAEDKTTDAALLGARKVKVKRSRYISAPIVREVWFRAGNQCQFLNTDTGHRCSCRHGLQVDHIIEFARGGSNELENLQLLCGVHNRWRSRATG